MIRIVDERQRIIITDAPERVSVRDRVQRLLIGPIPVDVEPEPEPEFFYGVDGGVARYDARTLSLNDGDPVAAWEDASGQLDDAVQDVVARQPAYTAGLAGVRFPGGGQHHLRLPSDLAFDELSPFTVVCLVTRERRNPSTGQLVGWGDLASQNWGIYQLTLGRATWLAGGNQRLGLIDAWPTGTGILDFQLDGSVAAARIDGASLGAPIAIGDVPAQAVVPSLGAQLDPGGGVDFPFEGVVHDLLFFSRALSTAELATVRAGISTDWGI